MSNFGSKWPKHAARLDTHMRRIKHKSAFNALLNHNTRELAARRDLRIQHARLKIGECRLIDAQHVLASAHVQRFDVSGLRRERPDDTAFGLSVSDLRVRAVTMQHDLHAFIERGAQVGIFPRLVAARGEINERLHAALKYLS